MPDTAAPIARPAAQPAPAQVPPPATPGQDGLLTLVAGVVAVGALYFARDVLIPITLAVLLSFVLAPLVELLRRIRLPRALAVLVAVLLGLGVILSIGGVIGVQIAGLATDIPRYAATIERKVATVRELTVGRISDLADRVGRQVERAAPVQPAPPPVTPGVDAAGAGPKPIPVEVHAPSTGPIELAKGVLEPIVAPLETALIVFIVAVFVLMQRDDVRDRLIRLFGSGDLHRTTLALDDAGRRLSRYFLTQLAINTCFGVLITIGLTVIGVPSPVLWGILAALMRFVPYVGAIIASVLPIALAAAVDPGWSMAIWTATLFLLTEPVIGHVVEPLVYGHSTGLSPLSVVVAAIFWTWLWGPIGLILSTPLTLCLVVLGRHVERLEFLDVLLGDRPALTPPENFYQRMLANDPDDALEQAELLLKERSLTAYYDEVALKGLQLAATDAGRGALSYEQLERIKRSTRALVHDLEGRDDRDPHPDERAEAAAVASQAEQAVPSPAAPADVAPPEPLLAPAWRGEAPVLCLAGRGPLDEAASTMLAQLLGKHGLGARTVPHEAASREGIAALDVEEVAMICVSYLEISGNPSHLRYLLRRLRRRAPDASILVGLWPAEDEVLQDQRLRAVIGADHYASSLHDAVQSCVQVAHEQAAMAQEDTGGGAAPETAGEARSPLSVVAAAVRPA